MRQPVVLAGAALVGVLAVIAGVFLLGRSSPAEGRAAAPTSHPAAEPDTSAATLPEARTIATTEPEPPPAPPAEEPAPEPQAPSEIVAGAEISGRVLDESGAPVVRALVDVFAGSPFFIDTRSEPLQQARTDTAGAFTFLDLHGEITLLAAADGLVCSSGLHGSPLPGRRYADVVLRVVPGDLVEGRVADESGAPVAGAKLAFDFSLGVAGADSLAAFTPLPAATETDARGHFEFAVAADRVTVNETPLDVRAERYATWSGQLPADDPAVIVLSSGQSLRGRVLDEAGKPVAGAAIKSVSRLGVSRTTSAADGSYSLEGVADVPAIELFTHAPGLAILVEQEVPLEPPGAPRHDILLGPGRVLAGRVLGSGGQPVAGAAIEIEGDRERKLEGTMIPKPTWERMFGLATTVTDAEGRFRIEDLYAGRFKLTAHAPEDKDTEATLEADSGEEQLELVLPDAAASRIHLFGQLTDATTGAPIEKARFSFFPRPVGLSTAGKSFDVDAPRGRYELVGPTAGEFSVSVSAEGFADSREELRRWTAAPERLDVSLVPLRTLLVEVVDADGRPAEGVDIEVDDETGQKLVMATDHGLSDSAFSDATGRARLASLPAKRLTVRARLGVGTAQDVVDLAPPLEATLRLVLGSPAVRDLSLQVFTGDVTLPADAGKAQVIEAMKAGKLQRFAGSITLVVRTADGAEVARSESDASSGTLHGKFKDCRGAGNFGSDAAFVFVHLVVPASPLSLELSVSGYPPWNSEVPEGTEPVRVAAVIGAN